MGPVGRLPDRVVATALVSLLAPYHAPGLDWSAGMMEDVAQMRRLAVAGREALEQAPPQLAETLTGTDLALFIESSSPTLSPPDRAISQTEVAAHLLASMREGLAGGAEGRIEDELALVAPRAPVFFRSVRFHPRMIPRMVRGRHGHAAEPGSTAAAFRVCKHRGRTVQTV